MVIVDGITGDVIVDPTEDELIVIKTNVNVSLKIKRITKLRDAKQ